MTPITSTDTGNEVGSPLAHGELTQTLNDLLQAYLTLMNEERGNQWSKNEEDVVRQVRDVLTRHGHAPNLPHEVTAHLDYPVFSAGQAPR